MNRLLIKTLIDTMRKHLPKDKSPVFVLIDILSLSKETAYRRLRGDIMFSFEEVAKLSRKLGFSLDKIVGEGLVLDNSKWAFIDINAFHTTSGYGNKYIEWTNIFSDAVEKLLNSPQPYIRSALTHLPYYLIAPYRNLVIFRDYKRRFLSCGLNPEFRFSDFQIPSNIMEKECELVKKFLTIPKNLLILERNVFCSVINDIHYFYQRQLISEGELLLLKESLSGVLSDLEHIAATGKLGNHMEVSLYLSDVELDTSYTHLESAGFEFMLQYSYFMDVSNLNNFTMCQMQKKWIESLKRYSTLISQTGEMQRVDFFRKQREMMERIG